MIEVSIYSLSHLIDSDSDNAGGAKLPWIAAAAEWCISVWSLMSRL